MRRQRSRLAARFERVTANKLNAERALDSLRTAKQRCVDAKVILAELEEEEKRRHLANQGPLREQRARTEAGVGAKGASTSSNCCHCLQANYSALSCGWRLADNDRYRLMPSISEQERISYTIYNGEWFRSSWEQL